MNRKLIGKIATSDRFIIAFQMYLFWINPSKTQPTAVTARKDDVSAAARPPGNARLAVSRSAAETRTSGCAQPSGATSLHEHGV